MTFERDYHGVVEQRRNRQTGTLISVVDNRDEIHMEIEPDGEGAWFVCCEEHGTIASFTSRRSASRFAPVPVEFCDGCRKIVGEES